MDSSRHISLIVFASIASAVSALNISISSGYLESSLSAHDVSKITELTLSGTMDARDFKFIAENLIALSDIDISQVDITEYSSSEPLIGGYVSFAADELPGGCFMGKNYRNVVLPNSIEAIGDCSFAGCTQIESVSIPASVKKIGDYAFSGATKLETISGGSNVEQVGDYAFSNCSSLSSIDLPAMQIIGECAFLGDSNLSSYCFPSKISSIGEGAFNSSGLSVADMSRCKSLKKIGNYAFADIAGLQEVSIPASVSEIGEGAFFYTSLQSVVLPNGVDNIDDFTFTGIAALADVELPSSLVNIGGYAFADCGSVGSITLPSGVESIGDKAFRNCSALTEINSHPLTPPALGNNVWENLNKSAIQLNVEDSSVSLYRSADQWRDFFNAASAVNLNEVYLRAAFDGDILYVKSSSGIDCADVYDLNGILVGEKKVGGDNVEFDLSNIGGKVFILCCCFEDNSVKYMKVIRNK